MTKQSMEERLREKLARVLVGYDKRYTVASLSIILDKMMVSIKKELTQARREEREKAIDEAKDVLIEWGSLKSKEQIEKIKPKHGNCCTCQDCGHYHDDCVCENNHLNKALDQLKLKVKEEK